MNHRPTDPAAREAYDDFTSALKSLLKAEQHVAEVLSHYTEDGEDCDSWRLLAQAITQFKTDRDTVIELLEEQADIENQQSRGVRW